jgi:hypothetical protein
MRIQLHTLRALAVTVVAAALASCSVKEERVDCPAYVTLRVVSKDHGDYQPLDNPVRFRLWAGVTGFRSRTVDDGLVFIPGYEFAVPRGRSGFSGVLCFGDGSESGGVLGIPAGEQCPPAWGFAGEGEFLGGVSYVMTVPLLKLFANLIVDVSGDPGGFRFRMSVNGMVDGFDRRTLQPVEGPFRHAADISSTGVYVVRIPRQEGYRENATKVSGKPLLVGLDYYNGKDADWYGVSVIDLAAVLADAGYDWGVAEPEDIRLSLVLQGEVVTRLVVSVRDWTRVLMPGNGQYVI